MKNPSSAFGWLGLTLVLLPIALVCLFLMVCLIIASPIAGIIFGCIAFAVGRAMFGRPKAR